MTTIGKRKILVIDDDAQLRQEIALHFETRGYEVTSSADGRTGLAVAKSKTLDLVILDITFPEAKNSKERSIDGIEVLRALRDSDQVPVLMLSTTTIAAVKVMALELGADDYLCKPFDIQELSSRTEAILRRPRNSYQVDKILNFRHLRLDPGERRTWKDGILVNLTSIEMDLLYTLARRPNHVFTREKLIELVWKNCSYSVPKVVDVHVGHIRKKIEDNPLLPTILVTVRGTGYRFVDASA